MTKHHIVSALNEALMQEMQENPKIVVLGEDVGVDGGVFRVTDGLIDKFGENRLIDTPLAEAGIVGASVGLAISGLRPVAEIQFSGFTYQAFHHIKQHMARFRQRTEGSITIPMVLRAPCSGGIRALEHHSESPEAFFVHCQGLKVVMPSNPYDAKGLMISALRSEDPVIFLEPKKIYRSFRQEVPSEPYEVEIGKAKVVKEGSDLTLISWGAMAKLCSDLIEEMPVDAELIDLRTLSPLDMQTILTSVKKTGRALIVQEATPTASMGSEIASRIQEKALLSLEAPVKKVSGFDVPYPQFALENYFLPNKKRVLNAINEVMEF